MLCIYRPEGKFTVKKNIKPLMIINIILPIVIVIGFAVILLQNHLYNSIERVRDLSEAERDGTMFIFDDITVDITTRGGDTGSWMFDKLVENDVVIMDDAVGTIYELEVINNTDNTITDWTAKIYIPEDMSANNSWNGDFEWHQGVNSGNEKVQTIDLADYSKYDIILDYVMVPPGPMIKLYEGDYYVYYPDEVAGEFPLTPKPKDPEKNSSARIGFIMYIQGKPIDYIADFSVGEIHYHMQTSIFKNPFFWIFGALAVLWLSLFLALIIVRLNIRRLLEQQKRDETIIEQTMQTFVNFIEAKDPSTMGHSLRVAQYSRMLAESMGFPESECKRVYYIALMHDCGKIYIPDSILSKPARLTPEEYEVMKKHTVYGGEILRDFSSIDDIGMGAVSHHERFDGGGYPNGLSGEDIPIVARIICVSDAFDAMNSKRCYRSSLPADVIIDELIVNKGKQFDPMIVDHLLKLIEYGAIKLAKREEDNHHN